MEIIRVLILSSFLFVSSHPCSSLRSSLLKNIWSKRRMSIDSILIFYNIGWSIVMVIEIYRIKESEWNLPIPVYYSYGYYRDDLWESLEAINSFSNITKMVLHARLLLQNSLQFDSQHFSGHSKCAVDIFTKDAAKMLFSGKQAFSLQKTLDFFFK